MQRKNYLLKKFHKNGMAMIMAIAVIVIMSTIMALSLSMTTLNTKKTVDLYLYEEANLLSKSATEYALLEIANHEPCSYLGGSFKHENIYEINISVQYVYDEDYTCNHSYTKVQTEEQNGSALIDVTISTDKNVSTEPIHIFRRTIQKL